MISPISPLPRPAERRAVPVRVPLHATISSVCSALSSEGILSEVSMPGDADIDTHLTGAAMSNRDCFGGEALVCNGVNFKPEYAIDGVRHGAALVVCSVSVAKSVKSATNAVVATVSDTHRALTVVPDAVYDCPARGIRTLGVTGTKGKTTATYMLKSILDCSDGCDGIDFTVFDGDCDSNRRRFDGTPDGASRTALIGSVATYDGNTYSESVNTTPEYPVIADVLHDARMNGFDSVVMEVSSQALKVGRVGSAAPFEIAGWLNIGPDHISPLEHPDFEDYISSKLKIFDGAETAVINARTDCLDRVLAAAESAGCRIVTFASEDADGNVPDGADVIAANIDESRGFPEFDIVAPSLIGNSVDSGNGGNGRNNGDDCIAGDAPSPLHVKLSLPGRFNVDDALLAACFALLLRDGRDGVTGSEAGSRVPHVRLSDIVDGLDTATVPGRMETYPCAGGSIVGIVDYAHNRMSYEALMGSMRTEHPDDFLIAVFGAPGRKALGRRRELPEVAAKYMDAAIITMEDPWDESPAAIVGEMVENLLESRGDADTPAVYPIVERTEAIDKAYEIAERESANGRRAWVMLLGKGDEQEQHIGKGSGADSFIEYPSDRELAIAHAARIDGAR